MLDFGKICNFCGATEDALLYNVFEPNEEMISHSVTLPLRIKDSLQIEAVEGDMMCHRCLYTVNSFHIFKEFTTQTYKSLHNTLEKLCPTSDNKTDADDANEDVQILEEKIREQPMVESPNQQLPANQTNPVIASKAAPKVPETVVIGIPGSSGTSKNSTNQRAPVNNNEPVRKGKRPWVSPVRTSTSVRLMCREEQQAASLGFRNELIEVNNSLVPLEEAKSNEGKCNVCLKTFTNTYSLKRHLVTHSSFRPFVCQICQKAFKDHSYLVKHERIHSRPSKQLTCIYCDLPFSLKSNLNRHMKDTHYTKSKSDSDVEVTSPVVANNNDDRECSSSPEHPVVCKLCLTTFRDVEGLNRHKKVHDDEMYHCDECQETFCEESNLEKHRNYIHAICETCLYPKLYECCCASERRKRTVKKLFCAQCSKSFASQFVLSMHIRGCRKAKNNDEEEIVID